MNISHGKEQCKKLKAHLKAFYSDGIRKLVDLWVKCIEKQGSYIEK
jgi:hypothetical protein